MTIIKGIFTSFGGLSGIIAGAVWLQSIFTPFLPPVWSTFITALFGLIAFYYHGKAVVVGRANGIKGI